MKKIRINMTFVVIALFCAISIGGIISLMTYVQKLLHEDIYINLYEVVTKNKEVIIGKISTELNYLELKAEQLVERIDEANDTGEAEILAIFMENSVSYNDSNLNFATISGDAYKGDGTKVNVAGRNYFKLGLKGISNISNRLVSRLDGSDIFVFCVPVKYHAKTIGMLLKYYSPKEMYTLCSASLFSDKGNAYIINSEGYILFSSEQSSYSRESDNYYRIIYESNSTIANKLQEDIKQNKSGFIDIEIDKKNMFFTYTPIEQIYDWYLITSIDSNVVSPNSNVIVQMFYLILFAVAILFTIIFLFYVRQKHVQQKKMEELIFVDKVTGGDSFTKFILNVSNILKKSGSNQLHICNINIINFKYLNRFYGYETGDKILKAFYDTYKNKLLSDELISRIAADRFVFLLTDISGERLDHFIDFSDEYYGISFYTSAGLYSIFDMDESISIMVDKSEIATKVNKEFTTKKVTLYNETFEHKLLEENRIRHSVELALEKKEIVPFFQAKVDIDTGKIIGAEALARWVDSNNNIISPGEFIPVCENTGLILGVDFAILEGTLKFIRTCMEEGACCVPISVNFSRLHLLNDDWLDFIIEKLEFYHVPPSLIEIEITETAIFDNYLHINSFIQKLHSIGIKVSMDDFGSGYSSLNMLKDIDIDIIKIDRNFLSASINNKRQRIIFGTIIEMSEKLNLQTIVEGVENEENIALMREFGCKYAQGYYFSKPVNIPTFKKIYKDGIA